MSEKAETRAAQSAKDSRATTAKVANVESRVAWLEQDAPEPFPVLPKQAERVEQQDVVVPQPWQVRAFDTTDRSNANNVQYKAKFQIYNPVLFFNGVPQTVGGGGSEWNILDVETPLSESLDVVARVAYTLDTEGKRSFESAEIVTKRSDEQKPEAEEGQAIDDIEIATLHGSGWAAITQHQVGPIYLGGGGAGGGAAANPEDFNVYITRINDNEIWLTQGQKETYVDGCSEAKIEPARKILRLDTLVTAAAIFLRSDGAGSTSKSDVLVRAQMNWESVTGMQQDVSISKVLDKQDSETELMRQYPLSWLKDITVSHPIDDVSQGYVAGQLYNGKFFSTSQPTSNGESVYFYTEVADANMLAESTHEDY